jgi:hypothetical protein
MRAEAGRRKWEVDQFGAHCTCAVDTISVLLRQIAVQPIFYFFKGLDRMAALTFGMS